MRALQSKRFDRTGRNTGRTSLVSELFWNEGIAFLFQTQSPREVKNYMEHPLRVAVYRGGPLFTNDAYESIAIATEGIPRNINSFCFNAPSLLCATRKKVVDADVVKEVLADLDIPKLTWGVPAEEGGHRIADFGLNVSQMDLREPQPYIEFLALQRRATVVVTDSGGIQEQTTYLKVPCLTLRNNTERPATVMLGTNVLVGQDGASLRSELAKILRTEAGYNSAALGRACRTTHCGHFEHPLASALSASVCPLPPSRR